ncbi:MAG: competence protein ComEC [Candidatus Eremiobacteraeota bacterium]|nr:competence protein ComEC [Candidatus Eremiobacteraeota bacterium]
MARAPLVLPALAFCSAIAAEAHGLGALVCPAALGTVSYRPARLAAAFALAGLVFAAWNGHPPVLTEESRTARFAGTVVGDVQTDEGGASFTFALDGGVVVRAHVRDDAIVPGERVVLRGRLAPFDEARNPGEPSRRAIALGEGIAGQLASDRVISRAPPDPRDVGTWAARARAVLSARLRASLREPEATVVAGALWGERGTLSRDLRDDFQATGTVHVLVTAGLHLGVIAWLVLELLRFVRVPRAGASLAAVPCVVAYAWLSGAHLPSQRAAVMVSVALLARAYGARLLSWNALALAALAVAALWPASVGTVSFALSFSCVGAILLFARPLQRALERWELPERIREALALTIATQIGVWPLSAATFGVLAPYAILANAIVVPATGVAMTAGIAALALANVPVAGRAAATLATWDVDLMLRAVTSVAALPGARVWVAPPPALAIVAYDTVAIVAAAFVMRRSARSAAALLACASIGVLATTLRLPDGRLTITMLDVGQGDAIVARTPRGHVVLIDSGGRLERGPGAGGQSPAELVGERVVLAYLKRQGVRRVDLLVNTHPHGDHVGGFAPIARALRVDAIADSGQTYGGRAFNDGLREAALHHVPVHDARCGDRWTSDDGVTLAVLSPCGALFADGNNDVNENSVVVMLTYRDFRMLFMGDAGFAAEQRLLDSGVDLHAAILKVGHHGSAYSSAPGFVAAVRPKLAIISAGRHNLFGHPAAATVATLRDAGATVYRTDLCGAVVIAASTDVRTTTALRC